MWSDASVEGFHGRSQSAPTSKETCATWVAPLRPRSRHTLSSARLVSRWFGAKDRRVSYLRIWLDGQTGTIPRSKASTISGLTFCFYIAKKSADGCWTRSVPLTYPLPEARPFRLPVSLRFRWDRPPAFLRSWQADLTLRMDRRRFSVRMGMEAYDMDWISGGAAIAVCIVIKLT